MSNDDLRARGEGPGYILVDLDRTLAEYIGWFNQGTVIGAPIPAMVERVQRWLHSNIEVRIFTARASRKDDAELAKIEAFCVENFGRALKVQNWKDFDCIQIWDDLAVTVEENTGERMTIGVHDDPITDSEEAEIINAQIESCRYET